MNEGIVIKYNANQRYTSDGVSSAIFKMICEKAGVPYQVYVNRSDIAGGSTPVSYTHLRYVRLYVKIYFGYKNFILMIKFYCSVIFFDDILNVS